MLTALVHEFYISYGILYGIGIGMVWVGCRALSMDGQVGSPLTAGLGRLTSCGKVR